MATPIHQNRRRSILQYIRGTSIAKSISYNREVYKQNPWGEISGSLGDLGTLLPIMTALATADVIDLNSTLIFTGVFNILSGMVFGVPIAVQPMKAIASVALSTGMSRQETMGAGLYVGIIILILSITGLLEKAGRIVPIPIVKGIQIGAGLSLIIKAGSSMKLSFPSDLEPLFWAILATILVFATSRNTRIPFALMIFVIGLAWVYRWHIPGLGFYTPDLSIPSVDSIYTGFWRAGAGQLPLTILNSIIAVNQLCYHLLPGREPSITSLGVSISLMNMIGCLFGSMPVCHGSGGLAGQYRCGARSGASIMLLGTLKLLVGLFVDSGMLYWLRSFPIGLLGTLMFLAGLELVSVGRTLNTTAPDLHRSGLNVDETSTLLPSAPISDKIAEERWMIMTITAGALVMFKNDFVGFAAGCAYCGLLWLQEQHVARRGLTGLD